MPSVPTVIGGLATKKPHLPTPKPIVGPRCRFIWWRTSVFRFDRSPAIRTGREYLQPVVCQKELQGCPACSPHGTSPALNNFQRSTWVPFQIHPTHIFPRNFLLAQITDGGISLVAYSPFLRLGIFNLTYGIQWHACSLRGTLILEKTVCAFAPAHNWNRYRGCGIRCPSCFPSLAIFTLHVV
jgi:hypothetical protein